MNLKVQGQLRSGGCPQGEKIKTIRTLFSGPEQRSVKYLVSTTKGKYFLQSSMNSE